MTQHNRETLLALADELARKASRRIGRGRFKAREEIRQSLREFAKQISPCATASSLDPTGEKA